jgi:hypothetical protein
MGKWIVVILIMGGLFYVGKRLMPATTAIDTSWMAPQIHAGMSQDDVTHAIGVQPTYVMRGGMGKDETWYYQDEYQATKQLAIQFIDGHVYQSRVEDTANGYR